MNYLNNIALCSYKSLSKICIYSIKNTAVCNRHQIKSSIPKLMFFKPIHFLLSKKIKYEKRTNFFFTIIYWYFFFYYHLLVSFPNTRHGFLNFALKISFLHLFKKQAFFMIQERANFKKKIMNISKIKMYNVKMILSSHQFYNSLLNLCCFNF